MRRGLLRVVAVSVLAATAARADAPLTETETAADGAPFEEERKAIASEGPPLRVAVGHSFVRAEARARLGYMLKYWADRFGIEATWSGDSVSVSGKMFGMAFNAVFDVHDHDVVAIAKDPQSYFFTGRARAYVEKKLLKYLHPTYAEP